MGDGAGNGRATLRAIFEAARDPDLSAEELRVWLLIRSYEGPDGAFPSAATLADHLGRSERTAHRHRARLMDKGYLQRTLRGPKPATYRAVVPGGPPDPPDDSDDGGDEYPAPSDAVGGNYPDTFEATWNVYPAREGSNNKKAAYRKWLATVRNGADPNELREATRIYADRMEREGKVGGRFVKQGSTFFGPDDYWREELANGRPAAPAPDRRDVLDQYDGDDGE